MGKPFVREPRYIVLKVKDILAAGCTQAEIEDFNKVCDKVNLHRNTAGKPPLECVVVEKDWPEYEATWAAIEARCA